MRERVNVKSPVREYCSPGSVRGAPGNRCPYLDMAQREAGERQNWRPRGSDKVSEFNNLLEGGGAEG